METEFRRYVRKMTLLDALTSAITDPYGTMQHLIVERTPPPYLLTTLFGFVAVLLLPVLIYQFNYEAAPSSLNFGYALGLTLVMTFLLFIPMLTILIRILGVRTTAIRMVAVVIYSLTPLIPLMGAYYIGNYITIGRLSIVVYLMTGHRSSGDWFLNLFPYFVGTIKWCCFLVFSQALRAVGRLSLLSSFLVALIAMVPLIAAFVTAVIITDSIFHDSATMIWTYLNSLQNIPHQ